MRQRLLTGAIGLRSFELTVDLTDGIVWTGVDSRSLFHLDMGGIRGAEVTLVFNRGGSRSMPEEWVSFTCDDADEAANGIHILTQCAGIGGAQRHPVHGFDLLYIRESVRTLAEVRAEALGEVTDTLQEVATAGYEQAEAFAGHHRLWTFRYCLQEELGEGGTVTEFMARKQGDLVLARVGVPILLNWGDSSESEDEKLLRFMHIGRFHDTTEDGGIVVRPRPREDTLKPGQTIMGFPREQIVRIAEECPLCNGPWAAR